MIAVESASVPSQSNTSRRNRRAAASAIGASADGGIEAPDELLEIVGQRGFDHQILAGQRVPEVEAMRVQEHALEARFRELPVPAEIAILVVAGEREAEMGEMDPD